MKPKYRYVKWVVGEGKTYFRIQKRFLWVFYLNISDISVPGHPVPAYRKTEQGAEFAIKYLESYGRLPESTY